jgi:hypothetical protein
MQIVAVADPRQVGSRQAMIGVTVRGDTRTVADALAGFDEDLPLPGPAQADLCLGHPPPDPPVDPEL